MRGLDIHKIIPVSVTKLTLGLRVGFISSHLMDKLFLLTEERSRVHRRWASCLGPKACLHLSSNKGISTLCTRMTLVGLERPTCRDRCSFKTSTGLSASQMVSQGRSCICTTYCIPVALMFQENFPTNTQVWNRLSHRNDCQQRGVI